MWKKLFVFVFFILIISSVYVYRVPIEANISSATEDTQHIIDKFIFGGLCSKPIKYTLGTFDTRFNLSKDSFLQALREAENIWEEPFNRDFFTYEENITSEIRNILKVNLVYDYRQEATSKLASLGIVVSENKTSYDMLREKFTKLKGEYTKMLEIFNTRLNTFEVANKNFETSVNFWNAKGGAPQKEFDELNKIQDALEIESAELKRIQEVINNVADEINALVVVLNRLASILNLSVDQYNAVNEERGESFQEGVYISDGVNKKIDVYEFSNRDKLVRVLAHEFGHALGLDHVEDSKAIMYSLNHGKSKVLSKMDMDALKVKCEIE